MIDHISIPACDAARVARVAAELMGARPSAFPPIPDPAMALGGDPHGTMIEAYPETIVLKPGEGDAPVGFGAAAAEPGGVRPAGRAGS